MATRSAPRIRPAAVQPPAGASSTDEGRLAPSQKAGDVVPEGIVENDRPPEGDTPGWKDWPRSMGSEGLPHTVKR